MGVGGGGLEDGIAHFCVDDTHYLAFKFNRVDHTELEPSTHALIEREQSDSRERADKQERENMSTENDQLQAVLLRAAVAEAELVVVRQAAVGVAEAASRHIATLTAQVQEQGLVIRDQSQLIAALRADLHNAVATNQDAMNNESRFLRRQVNELSAESRYHSRFLREVTGALVARMADIRQFVHDQHTDLTSKLVVEKRNRGTQAPSVQKEHLVLLSEKCLADGRVELQPSSGQRAYIDAKETKLVAEQYVTRRKEPCVI